MEATNLLLQMKLAYNQFTRTEKKIADSILADPDKVLFMSITELAEECGVAEASVHRFCRALHIKGYQEFKMVLSLSVNAEHRAVDMADPAGKDQGEKRFFSDILQYHLNAIQETNALLNEEDVNRTISYMTAARHIYFLGVGNSMTTAEEAYGRFLHITPKVSCVVDAHMQAMMASMASPEDLLVFFSYSGATKDNVQVARLARSKGARIVVITRYPKSQLTREADIVLICGSKESPLEGGSMGAKMSQLHIIDILFQCYYRENLEISRKYNKETAAANVERFV